jgi:hypothetical protein
MQDTCTEIFQAVTDNKEKKKMRAWDRLGSRASKRLVFGDTCEGENYLQALLLLHQ